MHCTVLYGQPYSTQHGTWALSRARFPILHMVSGACLQTLRHRVPAAICSYLLPWVDTQHTALLYTICITIAGSAVYAMWHLQLLLDDTYDAYATIPCMLRSTLRGMQSNMICYITTVYEHMLSPPTVGWWEHCLCSYTCIVVSVRMHHICYDVPATRTPTEGIVHEAWWSCYSILHDIIATGQICALFQIALSTR